MIESLGVLPVLWLVALALVLWLRWHARGDRAEDRSHSGPRVRARRTANMERGVDDVINDLLREGYGIPAMADALRRRRLIDEQQAQALVAADRLRMYCDALVTLGWHPERIERELRRLGLRQELARTLIATDDHIAWILGLADDALRQVSTTQRRLQRCSARSKGLRTIAAGGGLFFLGLSASLASMWLSVAWTGGGAGFVAVLGAMGAGVVLVLRGLVALATGNDHGLD